MSVYCKVYPNGIRCVRHPENIYEMFVNNTWHKPPTSIPVHPLCLFWVLIFCQVILSFFLSQRGWKHPTLCRTSEPFQSLVKVRLPSELDSESLNSSSLRPSTLGTPTSPPKQWHTTTKSHPPTGEGGEGKGRGGDVRHPLQTSIKTNNVEPHPHDDLRSLISGPHDE